MLRNEMRILLRDMANSLLTGCQEAIEDLRLIYRTAGRVITGRMPGKTGTY